MKKLKPEVSEFFKLVTIRPGTYSFPEFGSVDLTSINLAEARDLVKNGFKFLIPLDPQNVEKQNNTPENLNISLENLNERTLDQPAADHPETENIKGNKKYINKLLTLNYSDLEFKEKSIFFHDEKYFNEKKFLLQDVSALNNEMKSLHAKLKAAKSNKERKEINSRLWLADDLKSKLFNEIDTWKHEPPKQESLVEKAARIALEEANEIKTLTNYIGRFEEKYLSMPVSTEREREKKHQKIQQIEKRKARLIALGSPYQRKKRT